MKKNRAGVKKLAGYIAHRIFDANGSQIVVYVARAQGLHVGERYAVVCDLHGVMTGHSSKRGALDDMRRPEFCPDCMEDCVLIEDAIKEGRARVRARYEPEPCEVVELEAIANHLSVAQAIRAELSPEDAVFVASVALRKSQAFVDRLNLVLGWRGGACLSPAELAQFYLSTAKQIESAGEPS